MQRRSISLYLYELWLQQVSGGRDFHPVGQLAADTEFAVSDYGSLFLTEWMPIPVREHPNGGPAFPKGTPGIRLALNPIDGLTFQAAVYQAILSRTR